MAAVETITVSEAAKLLGVSRQYVHKLVKGQRLRVLDAGPMQRDDNGRVRRGGILLDAAQVREHLAAHP